MKNSHVRRGGHWMVMALLLAVAGCGGDTPTSTDGGGNDPVATTSVAVGNNFFDPASIGVSPGTTVTWTWAGGVGHNVTFASNAIANSVTQSSGEYQVAMPTATGRYTYQCTIHPTEMNGSVTVR